MVADPEHLRFYVDESALGLGKALSIARRDTVHVGHRLIPECPVGVLDPVWIPAVAERGLVVIGRDRRIRTKHEEIRQLTTAGLRVIRIGGKRDLPTWEWLVWMVKHWEAIEEIVRVRPEGPWFYVVNAGGLSEIPLNRSPTGRRDQSGGYGI